MSGIIGKKIGMTSIFSANGKYIPCTVIEAGPCVVTQVKTLEKDGYASVQLGFDEKKEKHTSAAMQGHFKKASTTPKRKIVEFKHFETEKNLGEVVNVELFAEGDFVDVVGTSKGKGFQGVVKRHGFHGGPKTHGQKNRLRAPGSIGATHPQHVTKGKKMAGRMGHEIINLKKCKIMQIDTANNILAIRGAVPGKKGDLIEIVGK